MIAGIALGPQVGFLTGAVSGFVSNLMFSQGPWTPWQMLAYGVAGLVMGLLAEKDVIPRLRLSPKVKLLVSAGAAVLAVCVVGPLLDTCTLFTMVSMLTLETATAIYLAGFPINCIHAIATFVTVYFLANPLLGKLHRVKTKYGMLD